MLLSKTDCKVTLPRGSIYRPEGIVLSPFENDFTRFYHCSKMFISLASTSDCWGIESNLLYKWSQQILRKQAVTLVILADSFTLDKQSKYYFQFLEPDTILITDNGVDDSAVIALESLGIEVLLVEKG